MTWITGQISSDPTKFLLLYFLQEEGSQERKHRVIAEVTANFIVIETGGWQNKYST